jgi:hypothetical protein
MYAYVVLLTVCIVYILDYKYALALYSHHWHCATGMTHLKIVWRHVLAVHEWRQSLFLQLLTNSYESVKSRTACIFFKGMEWSLTVMRVLLYEESQQHTASNYQYNILNRLLTLGMWELNKNSQNLARIGVQKRLHGTQILIKVNTQGTTSHAKKTVFHTAYNKIAGSVLKQHNINYQIK